jgi:hypothetical protein
MKDKGTKQAPEFASTEEEDAWRNRLAAYRRYKADPTEENRREYFEVAVPRWRAARYRGE